MTSSVPDGLALPDDRASGTLDQEYVHTLPSPTIFFAESDLEALGFSSFAVFAETIKSAKRCSNGDKLVHSPDFEKNAEAIARARTSFEELTAPPRTITAQALRETMQLAEEAKAALERDVSSVTRIVGEQLRKQLSRFEVPVRFLATTMTDDVLFNKRVTMDLSAGGDLARRVAANEIDPYVENLDSWNYRRQNGRAFHSWNETDFEAKHFPHSLLLAANSLLADRNWSWNCEIVQKLKARLNIESDHWETERGGRKFTRNTGILLQDAAEGLVAMSMPRGQRLQAAAQPQAAQPKPLLETRPQKPMYTRIRTSEIFELKFHVHVFYHKVHLSVRPPRHKYLGDRTWIGRMIDASEEMWGTAMTWDESWGECPGIWQDPRTCTVLRSERGETRLGGLYPEWAQSIFLVRDEEFIDLVHDTPAMRSDVKNGVKPLAHKHGRLEFSSASAAQAVLDRLAEFAAALKAVDAELNSDRLRPLMEHTGPKLEQRGYENTEVIGFVLDKEGECTELTSADTISSTISLVSSAQYKKYHGIDESPHDAGGENQAPLLDYRFYAVLKGPGAASSK